jgi:hypothetical protein
MRQGRLPAERFIAHEATSFVLAGVTEPRANGRVWATCPDNETAREVARALELYEVLGRWTDEQIAGATQRPARVEVLQVVTLGSKVRDTITGFEGIATGRSQFLNGCVSVCVTRSEVTKDGEVKLEWFDEQRIEVVERGAFRAQPSTATAGGPHSIPPRDGAR